MDKSWSLLSATILALRLQLERLKCLKAERTQRPTWWSSFHKASKLHRQWASYQEKQRGLQRSDKEMHVQKKKHNICPTVAQHDLGTNKHGRVKQVRLENGIPGSSKLREYGGDVVGKLGCEGLEPIHELRVEVLIFFPDQSEMDAYSALADGHELQERSDKLLQLLRSKPGRRLARKEGRTHTEDTAVYL